MNNDLISRKALSERLKDLDEWCKDLRKTGIEQARCMVHEAPAVDAEMVRRGEWVWDDDGYLRCGECNQKAPVILQYQDEPETCATEFCPRCGAKLSIKAN